MLGGAEGGANSTDNGPEMAPGAFRERPQASLHCAQKSPGDLAQVQILTPEDRGGARESVLLTSPQVMSTLVGRFEKPEPGQGFSDFRMHPYCLWGGGW